MIVKNKESKREYPITKANWEMMGRRQKLFIVVQATDDEEITEQQIGNSLDEKKDIKGAASLVKAEGKTKKSNTTKTTK